MEVNKSSWHYKLYSFTYKFFEFTPPQKTNLCFYVQRLIWMPLIIVLLSLFLLGAAAIYFGVIYPLAALIALLMGYKHKGLDFLDAVPYSGLKIKGFELYPWHLLIPVVYLFLHYQVVHHYGWTPMLIVDAVLATIISIISLIIWYSGADSLPKQYITAKKNKVCPVVEFKG